MIARFKFRFWDKKEKEYFTCGDIDYKSGIFKTYPFRTYNGCFGYKNIVAEQCTGLKDKNGRLIYAGDILGNKDFMSDVALLKYSNEKCCYILERRSVDEFFNKWWADRLMVIGNIHENKELLKWQKIFLI